MSEKWEDFSDKEKVKRLQESVDLIEAYLSEIKPPEKDENGCYCLDDWMCAISGEFESLESRNEELEKVLNEIIEFSPETSYAYIRARKALQEEKKCQK